MDTIDIHAKGPAVEDVQSRLAALGYDVADERKTGVYGEATVQAVRAFRRDRQLADATSIDAIAWSALVDATFTLGDRLLYLRSPYLHGNDVRILQTALNILGFFYHDVDGIFGGETETAVREFQLNIGLPADGIAGNTTFQALERLEHVWKGKALSSYQEEEMGFARVIAVLESTPLCVYGTDERARGIARRIGNLSRATTAASRIESADMLSGIPSSDMGFVHLATDARDIDVGVPLVTFSEEPPFLKKMVAAVHMARMDAKRIAILLPCAAFPVQEEEPDLQKRDEQHLAVRILDAICIAYI